MDEMTGDFVGDTLFLSGGGEMGALMRQHDWSTSPLGQPETWPQSLRAVVSLMLNSRYPMFVAWGPDLAFLYNDGYTPIFGAKHPKMLGLPFHEAWTEIWDDISPLIDRALAGEATYNEDLHLVMERNGYPEDTWYSFSYSPVRDESGAIAGMFCACTETTQRVTAESALRESEARLRALTDHLPGGIVYQIATDPDGQGRKFLFMSQRHEEFTGVPAEAVIKDASIGYSLVHEDDREILAQAELDSIAGKGPLDVEVRFRHINGDLRWCRIISARRTQPDGSMIWDGIQIDITGQKQALDALRESEERFKQIADSAPVPMWVTQLDRKRSFVNKAYLDFLHVDYKGALDFDWRTILHPDDHDRIIAESLAGEASLLPFVLEGRYRGGDGEWHWLISESQPRWGTDGTHTGFIGIAHDVTEAREAEAALRESEERFRFLDRLAEATQTEDDPEAVMAAATRLLGEHLGVDICAYADVEADSDNFHIRRDWTSPGVPSIVGSYSLNDFGTVAAAAQRGGTALVTRNAIVELGEEQAATFTSIGIAASICLPLVKQGRLAAMMAVHSATPRNWTDAEISLVWEVAERCWAHVERVGANAILRENEQRFREQFENANDFIFTTDLEMRITSCNPAVANALERTPEELIGHRISEYTPPETWNHNKAMLANKLAGKGDTTRYEIEVFDCRGERMMWEINSRLIRDPSGAPVGLHAIGRDVTERRRNEQALSAQNSRLDLLARIAGGLTLEKSSSERLEIAFNDIAQEVGADYYFNYLLDDNDPAQLYLAASFGLTDEQKSSFYSIKIGEYLCGRVAAARSPIILDDIDQSDDSSCLGVKELGGKSYAGFPLISDGRLFGTISFSSRSRGAFSAEEVALIQTVADQIAAALDRSRILAELTVSREKAETDSAEISAILGQLAEGVIVTDADGKINFVNDAATNLHGVAALDVEPSEYSQIYNLFREDGSLYPFEELPLTCAVVQGETVRDARWRIRRPDGSEVLVIGNAQPVLGTDGKAMGAVLTIRDDTARNAAEQALRELNETLEERVERRTTELELAQEALRQSQKLEAMGQLTGGVAHDFNNLLSPILGSLDMLQRRGVGDEREQKMIDGALQSAERAKLLVQRLLAFARRQPLKTVPVDMKALIDGMAELVGSTCGPNIKVAVAVEDNIAPALADPNQLEMAILNLSVNARDAMPDGGRLTLSATSENVAGGGSDRLPAGHYVRISVADTGTGMDEATRQRAVEPFFSTKGIGRGTGLGLSMAHGLASQLGGALTISSNPGLGTNVEFWLPASETPLEVKAQASREAVSEAKAGTILLVDDESLVRMSTADMLTDLGYEVIEASNAEEAMNKFETGRFDMLVTDHLMPGMSGVELVHAIQHLQPEMPSLIVSGYAENDGIPHYLARLTKPFRQTDLAAAIDEIVKRDEPVK